MALIVPSSYLFYDPDTSYYVEAARHLLQGRGLVVSTTVDKLPEATEILSLWPPGFPLVVAAVSGVLHVDPAWAAPKIVWLSWALLPAALLFALRPVLSDSSILIVSVLAMLAPGAIKNAWMPMSDIPFLVLVILSLGLLVRGNRRTVLQLLLSGALAGVAYAMRNVGIAIFPAVAAAYCGLAIIRRMSATEVLARVGLWGAGASAIVAPLMAWNYAAFGKLQPYSMPPSDVGLVTNVRYFAASVIADIFPPPSLIMGHVWESAPFAVAAAVALAIAALSARAVFRIYKDATDQDLEIVSMVLLYLAAGASVVVISRSTYQWGELINVRHVLQYDWIILALAALLIERWGRWSRTGTTVIVAGVAILIGCRVYYAAEMITENRRGYELATAAPERLAVPAPPGFGHDLGLKLAVANDAELIRAVESLPPDVVLLSNYGDVLRVQSKRIVHTIELGKDCDLAGQLRAASEAGRDGAATVAAVIFSEGELLSSGCWSKLQTTALGRSPLSLDRPYLIGFAVEKKSAAG